MARALGFLIFIAGVIGLVVGFVNSRIAENTLPHTNFGPINYTFFGPYAGLSAFGIFGGTTAFCYGLAMIWVTRAKKHN